MLTRLPFRALPLGPNGTGPAVSGIAGIMVGDDLAWAVVSIRIDVRHRARGTVVPTGLSPVSRDDEPRLFGCIAAAIRRVHGPAIDAGFLATLAPADAGRASIGA